MRSLLALLAVGILSVSAEILTEQSRNPTPSSTGPGSTTPPTTGTVTITNKIINLTTTSSQLETAQMTAAQTTATQTTVITKTPVSSQASDKSVTNLVTSSQTATVPDSKVSLPSVTPTGFSSTLEVTTSKSSLSPETTTESTTSLSPATTKESKTSVQPGTPTMSVQSVEVTTSKTSLSPATITESKTSLSQVTTKEFKTSLSPVTTKESKTSLQPITAIESTAPKSTNPTVTSVSGNSSVTKENTILVNTVSARVLSSISSSSASVTAPSTGNTPLSTAMIPEILKACAYLKDLKMDDCSLIRKGVVNGRTEYIIKIYGEIITHEPTLKPMSPTQSYDGKLIAALVTTFLLLFFIILGSIFLWRQRSYKMNQQHLTEELQTCENGYHDNPTLEVMEVQPEMQEKKMALTKDLHDSWIVPLENLCKDDREEEDTHL